jgi:hypothetical protein
MQYDTYWPISRTQYALQYPSAHSQHGMRQGEIHNPPWEHAGSRCDNRELHLSTLYIYCCKHISTHVTEIKQLHLPN